MAKWVNREGYEIMVREASAWTRTTPPGTMCVACEGLIFPNQGAWIFTMRSGKTNYIHCRPTVQCKANAIVEFDEHCCMYAEGVRRSRLKETLEDDAKTWGIDTDGPKLPVDKEGEAKELDSPKKGLTRTFLDWIRGR